MGKGASTKEKATQDATSKEVVVSGKELAKAKPAKAPTEEEKAASLQAALDLDKRIDAAIEKYSRDKARADVAIGAALNEMNETKGFKLLGFKGFVDYLKAKDSRYKKTYAYHVMRLAAAEGLDSYYEVLTAAQLVEYAKQVTSEKIPLLLQATAEEVSKEKLSARETADFLRAHIGKHPGKYKRLPKEGSKPAGPKVNTNWRKKFEKQHLEAKDKEAFIKGMEEYLKSLKGSKK